MCRLCVAMAGVSGTIGGEMEFVTRYASYHMYSHYPRTLSLMSSALLVLLRACANLGTFGHGGAADPALNLNVGLLLQVPMSLLSALASNSGSKPCLWTRTTHRNCLHGMACRMRMRTHFGMNLCLSCLFMHVISFSCPMRCAGALRLAF